MWLRCAFVTVLVFVSFLSRSVAMVEHFKTSIGREIRTLHQFKYKKGGTMYLHIRSENEPTKGDKSKDETWDSLGNWFGEKWPFHWSKPNKEDANGNGNGKEDASSTQRQDTETEKEEGTDASENALYLFHCKDSQLSQLNRYKSMSSLCADLDVSCLWSNALDSQESSFLTHRFEAESESWMTLIAVNCQKHSSFPVKVNIEAKNGASEYLSLSEIPYKTLYAWLAATWCLVGATWMMHWWRYDCFNTSFHRIVSGYPLITALSCVTWHFYWQYCSMFGVQSKKWVFAGNLTDAIADGWLFLSLMILAEGWAIIHYALESRLRYFEIGGVTLVLVCSEVISYYYTTLIAVMVFALVLTLHRIMKSHTRTTHLLKRQKDVLDSESQINLDPNAPLNVKLGIMNNLQRGVIAFLVVQIVYQWSDTLFLETPWIDTLVQHSIYVAFAVFIGVSTRMRPFRTGFHVLERGNERSVRSAFPQVWKPGADIPLLPKTANYEEWLRESEHEVIIVENDVDVDEESEVVTVYSLATPLSYDLLTQSYHPLDDVKIL